MEPTHFISSPPYLPSCSPHSGLLSNLRICDGPPLCKPPCRLESHLFHLTELTLHCPAVGHSRDTFPEKFAQLPLRVKSNCSIISSKSGMLSTFLIHSSLSFCFFGLINCQPPALDCKLHESKNCVCLGLSFYLQYWVQHLACSKNLNSWVKLICWLIFAPHWVKCFTYIILLRFWSRFMRLLPFYD